MREGVRVVVLLCVEVRVRVWLAVAETEGVTIGEGVPDTLADDVRLEDRVELGVPDALGEPVRDPVALRVTVIDAVPLCDAVRVRVGVCVLVRLWVWLRVDVGEGVPESVGVADTLRVCVEVADCV